MLRKVSQFPDICKFLGESTMMMPAKARGCPVLPCHGISNLKISGKVFLCISANSMIPGSMERERDTSDSIVHQSVTPATMSWHMIYSLIPSNNGSAFSRLPLSPSFLQQGTAISRKKNNGILYI